MNPQVFLFAYRMILDQDDMTVFLQKKSGESLIISGVKAIISCSFIRKEDA